MNRQGRTQLALGVIFKFAGAWFLLDKTVPSFHNLFDKYTEWPINMLLIGAGIFVGLVFGTARPLCTCVHCGGHWRYFLYQEMAGGAASWSYMWTLIPGFVGVGWVCPRFTGREHGSQCAARLKIWLCCAVLFLIFSTFLGDQKLLGNYGAPILSILLGVYVLGRGLYTLF